jgi:hypothetical protein
MGGTCGDLAVWQASMDLSSRGDRVGCLLNGLIRSVNSSVAQASRSKGETDVGGMARAESRTAKA